MQALPIVTAPLKEEYFCRQDQCATKCHQPVIPPNKGSGSPLDLVNFQQEIGLYNLTVQRAPIPCSCGEETCGVGEYCILNSCFKDCPAGNETIKADLCQCGSFQCSRGDRCVDGTCTCDAGDSGVSRSAPCFCPSDKKWCAVATACGDTYCACEAAIVPPFYIHHTVVGGSHACRTM